MSTTLAEISDEPVCLDGLGSELRIRLGETAEEMRARFNEFLEHNPELIVEQDPSGEIIVMSPAGASSARSNSEIARQLGNWAIEYGGWTFDSSAMFILPNGAKRSPDAAWISAERWDALPPEQREKFPSMAPDFVLELRSKTDRLMALKTKMQEYIDNGVRMAWLVDPQLRQVHVYQNGKAPEMLDQPGTVSGAEVLPGFVLETARIYAS